MAADEKLPLLVEDLRDHFATAAMMGIVQKTGLAFDAHVVAEESFKLADAMVAERKKRYGDR